MACCSDLTVPTCSWVVTGLGFQLVGLAICVASFFALGRSFGFAPADRGLRRRGPYSVVRHPIYASYFLLQLGYVLQSISVRNVLVMVFVCSCNVGRVLARSDSSGRAGPTPTIGPGALEVAARRLVVPGAKAGGVAPYADPADFPINVNDPGGAPVLSIERSVLDLESRTEATGRSE